MSTDLAAHGMNNYITDRDASLTELHIQAQMLFERAIEDNEMRPCDFEALEWEAPVARLLFYQAQGTNGEFFPHRDKEPFADPRCVRICKAYMATKLSKSSTQRRQHLAAIQLVLHVCGNDLDGLADLSKEKLSAFMHKYAEEGGGAATGIDNRLAGEKGLVSWLRYNNLLRHRFTYETVVPSKHQEAKYDATSPAAAKKVNNKRPPQGLDAAIGEIVAKTEGGENEPNPGYYRLRVIAATYMMAAGLRIGEAAALQTDCFHEHNGMTWLKVLSEKSGEPRLVPLGAGWETLLKKRHAEVMELTREARQNARALEDGSLFQGQKEALKALREPHSLRRYKEAGYDWLLEPDVEVFEWISYYKLGLLPKFSEASSKLQKHVIQPLGYKSKWLPFEIYESYIQDEYKKTMSNHLQSAVSDLGPDSSQLRRAGYQVNLPLADHLFIIGRDQFHMGRPTKYHRPRPLLKQDMDKFLVSSGSVKSAFEQLNIRDGKGEIFKLREGQTTHVFRHWKDDARYRAGCNETAMAVLSGRAPEQNRAYDKRTPTELAGQHRHLYLQASEALIPRDSLGMKVRKMLEVGKTKEEIETTVEQALQILHLTPWSGCSRDLDREPCPKHYKCLRGFSDQAEDDSTCPNLHINPNDLVAKENVEYQLRVSRYQVEALSKLCGDEAIDQTLKDLDQSHNPERGRTILEMQLNHQRELVNGCEAALKAYEAGAAGGHTTRDGKDLQQVASANRIHAVQLIDPKDMR